MYYCCTIQLYISCWTHYFVFHIKVMSYIFICKVLVKLLWVLYRSMYCCFLHSSQLCWMFSMSELLLSLLEAFIIICMNGRKFPLTIKINILIALVRYLLTSHIRLVQNISLFTNAILGNKRCSAYTFCIY